MNLYNKSLVDNLRTMEKLGMYKIKNRPDLLTKSDYFLIIIVDFIEYQFNFKTVLLFVIVNLNLIINCLFNSIITIIINLSYKYHYVLHFNSLLFSNLTGSLIVVTNLEVRYSESNLLD